jgi:TonB family protein
MAEPLSVLQGIRPSNPARDDRCQSFAWRTPAKSSGGQTPPSLRMKLNKNERARPNVAGLTSPAQQADMDLLLAGQWPALKPLPVFRYEGEEYRATIHFDKMRGEWVCRRTSLPADKAQEVRKDQELRGGLTEMTMALPHGDAEASSEAVAAEQPKLERYSKLHLQAVLAWRENYGNGEVYSGLQGYLSERQQEEVYDIVRMSLTAWQLQFNPKNIAFIFDVLWNAGGRLATLIEIARLEKAECEAGARRERILPAETAEKENAGADVEIKPQQSALSIPVGRPTGADDLVAGSAAEISSAEVAQSFTAVASSEPARDLAPDPIEIDIPKESEGSRPEHVGSFMSTNLASFATESIKNPSSEHLESPGRIARNTPQASEGVASEILGASRWSIVEIFRKKTPYDIPLFGFRGFRIRHATSKVESSPCTVEGSPSQLFVSEKSVKKGVGLRITAIVFLMVGFTIGFTVGLNTPIVPRETEESSSEKLSSTARPADSAPPVQPIGSVSAVMSLSRLDSDNSLGAQKRDGATALEEKSKETVRDFATLAQVPSRDSISPPAIESRGTANRDDASRFVARNASPPALPEPVHLGKAAGSMTRTPRETQRVAATGRVTPPPRATPRASPSSAILVTAPAEGSRSLKLTFPEKPIAVSPSFAITSQLSVLVAPEPGRTVAHHPARLQAGKLVSYVWPHYPRPGIRDESTETVKVLATIGRFGQVVDVKRVSGSSSLSAAAMSAIRQWRFQPTLLNERPVQSLQNVTIEYRSPRYSSQVSTRRALPN